MPITNTIPPISEEYINKAHRIENADGSVFYLVESATDPDVEYKVERIKREGRKYYTCQCKAGQAGRDCWHKRAAVAHSDWYHAQATAIHITAEFHIPNSRTTIYTVQQGHESHDVVRYGNGSLTCNCQEYTSALERLAPMTCKHCLEVTTHLQQHLEEMADYLHQVVVGRR
jgi:hypothetical protein